MNSAMLAGFLLIVAAPLQDDARKISEVYRSIRPTEEDLRIYRLSWAPSLEEARRRASKEKRPIFLLVCTNSYGNMYTGHC